MTPLSTIWGEQLEPTGVLPEYPRPSFVRTNHINLNGVWRYAITNTAEEPFMPDGTILVPFSPESRLSGVERTLKPDEYLWYFKTLPVVMPPSPGARLLLHFGAVDQTAEVYVNGRYQCTHVGGYLPFTADITDALLGSTGNRLVVRVQDFSQTSHHARGKQTLERGGMFYSAQSGIWQTVWMEWVPKNYIRALKITPHDDLASVTVRLETNLPAGVEVAVYGDDDKPFTKAYCSTGQAPEEEYPLDLCRSGSDVKPCNKIGKGCFVASLRLLISDARCWTPEDPYLYRMSVRVGDDTVVSYFAIRCFSVERDEHGIPRFCLNHKPYFLNGVLDQGYWPDGLMTAPGDKALIYDITQMKRLGFNMMRKHVKVECARWYYHCDRMGMLVWQDIVSGGMSYARPLLSYIPALFPRLKGSVHDGARNYKLFSRADEEGRKQWINEMKGTIEYLHNSPSICCFVLFNEGWGQFDARKMTEIARELDPSRVIDQASGWFDQGGGDFRSVHNYSKKLTAEKDRHGRAYVLSEYGGYALHVPGHAMTDRVYGKQRFNTIAELNEAWRGLVIEGVDPLIEKGLAGAVYTQVSDIEDELNGIMTYDRKVIKLEPIS
ncbi:MAG: glycoside hydrolase family 2 [Lachnospiraceae bacterium]|nr:glycoside hydrolase family 2 [Lachnospiraceae bacterium]